MFGFLFSDKCGFSTERLLLNKRRDTVENVAGMAFLLAADRVQTGSYTSLDYIIGDTGISQGRYAKNRRSLFSLSPTEGASLAYQYVSLTDVKYLRGEAAVELLFLIIRWQVY